MGTVSGESTLLDLIIVFTFIAIVLFLWLRLLITETDAGKCSSAVRSPRRW